jgi:hypothetical protein
MLSGTAVATLAFLRTIPDRAACENCIGTYLGVDREATLGSIRALVQAGRIVFPYGRCAICRDRRLVAQLRPPSELSPPHRVLSGGRVSLAARRSAARRQHTRETGPVVVIGRQESTTAGSLPVRDHRSMESAAGGKETSRQRMVQYFGVDRGWGTRVAFLVAAGVAVVALILHASTWWRIGAINWPAAMNLSGLVLLTVVGAVDLPRGRARFILSVVALLLIVPSAFFLWLR